jgi:uncharacterized membrane protein YgaE (UPF0421/DUF939 family)
VVTASPDREDSRLRRRWRRFAEAISWTRPTSTEVGIVLKAGLAAGLAWGIARLVTDVPNPLLAPLTAIVTVRVSVRSSVSRAVLRSLAVALGVLLALALGDTIHLNGVTIGLLVAGSLAIAELLFRLPLWAATQVPISILVVLGAVATPDRADGWRRAVDTMIGAAVGVAVSLLLPASRRVDARQTLDRLADGLERTLDTMGQGLGEPWTSDDTTEWRREAHIARDRLVQQALEAVGDSREAARWNHRDRRHVDELGRYEELAQRSERAAIGVSSIARTFDEFAHRSDEAHRPLPRLAALVLALARGIRAVVNEGLGEADAAEVDAAITDVRAKREECMAGARRRARLALESDVSSEDDRSAAEWLGYAAVLVHVDRIVHDLTGPLPD